MHFAHLRLHSASKNLLDVSTNTESSSLPHLSKRMQSPERSRASFFKDMFYCILVVTCIAAQVATVRADYTDNMVARYNFATDANASGGNYNEVTGAYDAISQEADDPGSFVGPTWNSRSGGYMGLDGSDAITIPHFIDNRTVFSVAAWFRSHQIWRRSTLIGAEGGYRLFIDRVGRIGFTVNDVTVHTQWAKSDNPATWRHNDDKWHHVVATYNGSQIQLYLDGVAQTTSANVSGAVETDGYEAIGAMAADDTRRWIGDVDDVRLYTTVLNQTQVSDVFNSTSPVHPFGTPEMTLRPSGPCNIFESSETIVFNNSAKFSVQCSGQVVSQVRDYFGDIVSSSTAALSYAGGSNQALYFQSSLTDLGVGYYELETLVDLTDGSNNSIKGFGVMSFGVVPAYSALTAEEYRTQGKRFGLKFIWRDGQRGVPDWDEVEGAEAQCLLGLSWSRANFFVDSVYPMPDLLAENPINMLFKIESMGDDCWNEPLYGPLADWIAANPRLNWKKDTVPLYAPYMDWMASYFDPIKAVAPDQRIFEFTNERWGEFEDRPDELALLCQYSADGVINTYGNDVLMGTNLYFEDPIGRSDFNRRFFEEGGLDRQNMITIHPYTQGTPENKGFRQRLRNYHDWLMATLGRDVDLYTTEYGKSTVPESTNYVGSSEQEQAIRVSRQTLMMYAEDVKTMIPHTQTEFEREPGDQEDWFGFFHPDNTPKPVVLAYSNAARLIDGGRFVGDVWVDTGVAGLLFERDDVYTLAVWTQEVDMPGVEVPVGDVSEVTVYNVIGESQTVTPSNGSVALDLDGGATYLVGVDTALADNLYDSEAALDPGFFERHPARTAFRLTTPTIDGDLSEWENAARFETPGPVGDSGPVVSIAWDDFNLYLALDVTDDSLEERDNIEFRLGAKAARQIGSRDVLYDHHIFIRPRDAVGQPTLTINSPYFYKSIEHTPGVEASGFAFVLNEISSPHSGYIAEVRIPLTLLPGFSVHEKASLWYWLRDYPEKRWLRSDPDSQPREYAHLLLDRSIGAAYEDFEDGLGLYTAGSGAQIVSSGGIYQGAQALQVEGPDGIFWLTDGIDPYAITSNPTNVAVDFQLYASSLESGEGFILDYWNGSQWFVAREFEYPADFENDTHTRIDYTINTGTGPIPSELRIRFRSATSDAGDVLTFDEVRVRVAEDDSVPAMETGVASVDDQWKLIRLNSAFTNPVVVCSVRYDSVFNQLPVVPRVRNAGANSFELRLQNPSDSPVTASVVSYMVVEEGTWRLPNGAAIEARRVPSSDTASRDTLADQAETFDILGRFEQQPVILGQVMTANDPDWSVFYCINPTDPQSPPAKGACLVGKHVGADTDTTRADETLGVIAIESFQGSILGVPCQAAVGNKTVRGIDDSPPYNYTLSGFSGQPRGALVTRATVENVDGSWAYTYGEDALSQTAISLVCDEDQIGDTERSAVSDQVGYCVFGESWSFDLVPNEIDIPPSRSLTWQDY